MSTANLNVGYVAPNSNAKEVQCNAAFDAIDAAVTAELVVPTLGADVTLTTSQFASAVSFEFSGVLMVGHSVFVPTGVQRLFVVSNDTTGGFALTVVGATSPPGSTVNVLASDGAQLLYSDGANIVKVGAPAEAADTLAGATDVTITSPANADVLTFDTTSSKWKNRPVAAAPVSSVFTRTGAVVAATNDYSEAQISFSDITTNNVSITAHGLAPKAPNDATKYLDGTGAYSTPPGGSSSLAGDTDVTLTSPANNDVLTFELSSSRWKNKPAGSAPVSSVFTRTGAVVATSGDYTVAQVTGAAPLASPTFTGTVTLPSGQALIAPVLGTPASGTLTNCTGLPAASIVAGTMASGMTLVAPALGTPASGNLANCTGFPAPNAIVGTNTQTSSYTTVLGDAGQLIRMNVATANTLTIPPNSSVAYPLNTVISIRQIGAGITTVTQGVGVTITSPTTGAIARKYGVVQIVQVTTDHWDMFGDC